MMSSSAKTALANLLIPIFPFPPFGNADEFAKMRLDDPEAISLAQACEVAIRASSDDKTVYLVEHARRLLQEERERQASVMGRAQSLFFAMALLSFFATFSASLVTSPPSRPLSELFVIAAISIMILIQIVLLLINVIRAIQGLSYMRAGSSDVIRWASKPNINDIYRDEAVLTLKWYRDAADKNTWRFKCLDHGTKALRNIVYCVCVLIIVFFVYAFLHPVPKPVSLIELVHQGEPASLLHRVA